MPHDVAATNTVCPVCGKPVALDMPPITSDPGYSHQNPTEGQRLFRVCSASCAARTASDPVRYRMAAEVNAIAPVRGP